MRAFQSEARERAFSSIHREEQKCMEKKATPFAKLRCYNLDDANGVGNLESLAVLVKLDVSLLLAVGAVGGNVRAEG